MVVESRPARARRWLGAGLLAVGAAAVAIWWPSPGEQAQPSPRQSAALAAPLPAPVVLASPLTTSTPTPQEPDPAALPQLRIPAAAAGQDPFVAALEAARQNPPPPPAPEIATAKSLEQAFAAMQAAQAEAAVPARTSPFAAR